MPPLIRSILRAPSFTAAVISSSSLGVAAVAIIAMLVDTILISSAPWMPHPSEVVRILSSSNKAPESDLPISWEEFTRWKTEVHGFVYIGASSPYGALVTFGKNSTWESGATISAGFFEVLGVQPILGRLFLDEDFRPAASPTVVVSQHFWMTRLNGSESVLGSNVTINNISYVVIGVLPESFNYPSPSDYWIPLVRDGAWKSNREDRWLFAIGRLGQAAQISQIESQFSIISASETRLLKVVRKSDERRIHIMDFRRYNGRAYKDKLIAFSVVVGLLQFLVFANTAGLMAARNAERTSEYAIKAALGASRLRLLMGLLAEGFVLSVASFSVGLGIAYILKPEILNLLLPEFPLPAWWSFTFRLGTLLITFVIGSMVTILSSVVAAKRTLDPFVAGTLKSAETTHSSDQASKLLRTMAVGIQFGLCALILAFTGLISKAELQLSNTDIGISSANVAAIGIAVLDKRSDDSAQKFYPLLLEQIRNLPGVEFAGAAWPMPGQLNATPWTAASESHPDTDLHVTLRHITPGLLKTMTLPLIQGRDFATDDKDVALVDQNVARTLFPDGNALGMRVSVNTGTSAPPEWLTVVGIVGPVKTSVWAEKAIPAIYRPLAPTPRGIPSSYIYVKSHQSIAATVAAVTDAIRQFDPDTSTPISYQGSYERWIAASYWAERFAMRIMILFTLIALVVSSVGLFGLTAYAVGLRKKEIAIRLAIGATPKTVFFAVLGQSVRAPIIGAALGILTAFVFANAVIQYTPHISPRDPLVYLSTLFFTSTIATLACWPSTRSATRTSPSTLLREQ